MMKIDEIKRVLIVGSGTMGQQIGLQCAMHGYNVTLYDISLDMLNAAMEQVKGYAAHLEGEGRLKKKEVLARIKVSSNPQEAADDVDLISESVPEDPVLKAKVFAQFSSLCPARTIFTTNTSTLVPSMYAQATGRPAQFASLHFHTYVWNSNIVDIMPHPGTSQETVDLLYAFAKKIGQIPIVMKKESHQYLLNAMLGALNTAAVKLAVDGVASVEDIDRAWMGVMGMPIGPFGILDVVGLKTVFDIVSFWATTLNDPQMNVNSKFIKTFVDKGWLGVKTGHGFYTYPDPAYARPGFVSGETAK